MHTAFKHLLKQLGIYTLGMLVLFSVGACSRTQGSQDCI
jgi:hypothetical protein